ncbi:hypothetical protein [Leifsonia shinshuensis]
MGSKLRPGVVLWWGIGLTLGGVLLTIAIPQLGYTVVVQPGSANGVDQALLTLIDLAVRAIAQVISPLGVALIGAAVVMAYVDRPRALAAGLPDAAGRPRPTGEEAAQ